MSLAFQAEPDLPQRCLQRMRASFATAGKSLLLSASLGAAAGLAVFGIETVLVLRSGDAMIAFDRSGVAAAGVAAARPALENLLLRVAVAYAAAGAVLGAASGAFAGDVARRRRGFWTLCLLDAAAICAIAAWAACIERPGLFEDVEWLHPVVGWITRRAEPWQPALAAATLFAVHLARSRRRLRTALGGAAAFAVALLPKIPVPGSQGRHAPLVVLVGIDAFRPDRIEGQALQRHLAPNLERFLRGAVRFDRAYTPIAQTEPAWAALSTASWPTRTGVRHPLAADAGRPLLPTVAGAFSAAGFSTTFATDCSRFNWQGPASGFRERLQPPRGAENFVLEKLRYRALGVFAANSAGSWWVPELIDNRALAGFYDPFGYARRLGSRLAAEAREGPLFFAYHDTVIHYPGDVVWPYYREHAGAPLRMWYALPGSGPARSDGRERREELYDELLSEADAQLGILFDGLRAEGRYDDALIVVFSDHGEGFQPDLPALAPAVPVHGARLSDDENRILLAIKPPAGGGIAVGRTDHELVRLIDIGPTLLEASGLAPLPGADGVSLLPRLRGSAIAPLRLYAETGFTHVPPDAFDSNHFSGGPRGFDAYRVRDDGVIEMSDRAHALAMQEKDVGAYDGQGWLIRSRRADGSLQTRCRGECSPELAAWLEGRMEGSPLAGPPKASF